MPVQARAIGTVRVISTVSVRPRVNGELTEVHFKEGDYVKAGDKLFTIDPLPYEAAVLQAKANLKKSEVALKGAELELARVRRGGLGGVVAESAVEAAETAVAAAEAGVAADKVAIHTAELQKSFTTITSPITGRAGALLVTRGNLVTASDLHPLVVINQISPIDVAFTLPEDQLPLVMEANRKTPLRVEADPRGPVGRVAGVLSFIDNTVDPETGTVEFKAEFENEDNKLWPGLFVDVVVTVGRRPDSVVIPASAVQSGQKGQYVYVVDSQRKAELRPVTVAFEVGNEAVIAAGLKGDETVVVEGQLRLAPGTKVEPRALPPAPAATPPVAAGVPSAPAPRPVTGGAK
jgi:multidrug efflux system membrane fusion protein